MSNKFLQGDSTGAQLLCGIWRLHCQLIVVGVFVAESEHLTVQLKLSQIG